MFPFDHDTFHASFLCRFTHFRYCSISFFLFTFNFLCNLYCVPDISMYVSFSSLCADCLYRTVLLCVCVRAVGGLIRRCEKAPWPMEGLWFRHHSGPVPTVYLGIWPRPRGLWHLRLHRGVRRSLLWVGRWLMESWRDGLWTLSRVLDRIVAVPE